MNGEVQIFAVGLWDVTTESPVLSPAVDADHALALSGKSRVCSGAPRQTFLFFPAAPHSELSVAVLSVPKGSVSWWCWVGIDCNVPRDLP